MYGNKLHTSASFSYNVVASLPHFSPSLRSHFRHKCPFFGALVDVRKRIFAFSLWKSIKPL